MRRAADTHALADVVFLLDVDNTLLDNDAVIEDLRRHLSEAFSAECEQRYWDIFEELRRELGYADYLGSLQRYRRTSTRSACATPLAVSAALSVRHTRLSSERWTSSQPYANVVGW